MGSDLIKTYFPEIDQVAIKRLEQLQDLYNLWNQRINVISRKDLSNLYVNHVLHSLSLAKVIPFRAGEKVLDIGTGGGFPGIPLAILHPDLDFTLIDARGKKIKVVREISKTLALENVNPVHTRAEEFKGTYHYVLNRAVTFFPKLVEWSAGYFSGLTGVRDVHGLYSLKGGYLEDEISGWKDMVEIYRIENYFKEDYFKAKCIVFLAAEKLIARSAGR